MKRLTVIGGVLLVTLLAGCSQGKIVYEGEERPVIEVEDVIGDKLEVNNPGKDIEVNIMTEVDE